MPRKPGKVLRPCAHFSVEPTWPRLTMMNIGASLTLKGDRHSAYERPPHARARKAGSSKVKAGRYNSASEVVRETLRLFEERDQLRELQLREVRRKINAGWASLEQGEGIDGEEFFRGLEREERELRRKRERAWGLHTLPRGGARHSRNLALHHLETVPRQPAGSACSFLLPVGRLGALRESGTGAKTSLINQCSSGRSAHTSSFTIPLESPSGSFERCTAGGTCRACCEAPQERKSVAPGVSPGVRVRSLPFATLSRPRGTARRHTQFRRSPFCRTTGMTLKCLRSRLSEACRTPRPGRRLCCHD